eukprot:g1993.t1
MSAGGRRTSRSRRGSLWTAPPQTLRASKGFGAFLYSRESSGSSSSSSSGDGDGGEEHSIRDDDGKDHGPRRHTRGGRSLCGTLRRLLLFVGGEYVAGNVFVAITAGIHIGMRRVLSPDSAETVRILLGLGLIIRILSPITGETEALLHDIIKTAYQSYRRRSLPAGVPGAIGGGGARMRVGGAGGGGVGGVGGADLDLGQLGRLGEDDAQPQGGGGSEGQQQGEDGVDIESVFHPAYVVTRTLLWTVGGFLALSLLGVDTSSVVAGLGIGGLTVGLALQTTLKDLLGTVAIITDKPFKVGDSIELDGHEGHHGTVEAVGVRSTRIRTRNDGHVLHVPNSHMASCLIRNGSELTARRIHFFVKVHPATPLDKLRLVQDIIEGAIHAAQAGPALLDTVAMTEVLPSGFSFEVIYFCMDDDIKVSRSLRAEINFGILQGLHDAGIRLGNDLAYGVDSHGGAVKSER